MNEEESADWQKVYDTLQSRGRVAQFYYLDQRSKVVERQLYLGEKITYAIACLGYVKFGSSTNLKKRMSMLQIGCPIEMVLLGVSTVRERQVHFSLREHRHRGEWFFLNDEVRRYITENFKQVREKR
jgi:hypothetical protein